MPIIGSFGDRVAFSRGLPVGLGGHELGDPLAEEEVMKLAKQVSKARRRTAGRRSDENRGEGRAMKRVSLSNLAVNAPPAPPRCAATAGQDRGTTANKRVSKISSDEDNELEQRVQVAFRMDKDAYKDLKRMALDEDTTVNELMIRAINELRERQGLKKLAG